MPVLYRIIPFLATTLSSLFSIALQSARADCVRPLAPAWMAGLMRWCFFSLSLAHPLLPLSRVLLLSAEKRVRDRENRYISMEREGGSIESAIITSHTPARAMQRSLHC